MTNLFFDNTDQLRKIGYRLTSYWSIGSLALRKGISPIDLVRSRFPFHFPEAPRPSSLSVELTDACDLKCLYCTNPGFPNPRTFMPPEVIEAILRSLDEMPVHRIRIGGGEPTLHPRFAEVSRQFAQRTRLLSVVTNGQWRKAGIAEALVAHYDLVEISIDAGGASTYERSRPGGSHDRLLQNLDGFLELSRKVPRSPRLNIRLMLRPSTAHLREQEMKHWSKYAATVMPQYVMKDPENDYADDCYLPEQVEANTFPRCTLPFKDIQVRANGNVPLCQITGSTTDPGRKRIIGNVVNTPLKNLWTAAPMRSIRAAHRNEQDGAREVCRGCRGC